jgi:hypothetical protein
MTAFVRARCPLLSLVFGLGVVGPEAAMKVFAAEPVRSDVVLAWNKALIDCAETRHPGQSDSGATAFLLAVMHGAMEEGIAAVEGDETGLAGNDETAAAAGSSAARAVLAKLLPGEVAIWDRLLEESLADLADERDCTTVMAIGTHVASGWLERHGYAGAAVVAGLNADEASPRWLHSTRPFMLGRADQIRATAPDVNTILRVQMSARGRSTNADVRVSTSVRSQAEQVWWAGPAETSWNRIAREWAAVRSQDLRQRACLFAALNAAMADGYLAAYESREHYRNGNWYFVLGRTAEALGASGSPPETRILARVKNYPAVRPVVTAAAMEVLQSFGGDGVDRIVFAGPRQSYDRLLDAAQACAAVGGPTENDLYRAGPAGFQQGRKIGRWIAQQFQSRPLLPH